VKRGLVLSVLLAIAACSPGASDAAQSSPSASVHAESGLRVVPLTVTTTSGKKYAFRVEVAASAFEQARGLMYRRAMGADEGMVFPMSPARAASFWMRNTVIPLDLIFIGVDGRISNIAANAIPYDESPLRSVGLVKAVLELNGGRAAALGIAPGDKVDW
jgi:uncharacterized membrane protein (UPF0127 family)